MDLKAEARKAAAKWGIPENIFFGLIRAESSWNPNAVSRVGALGLTQVMPKTAVGMGYDPAVLKKDPQVQLDAGARYLSTQYSTFGRWDYALAAYHAGPGRVQKAGGIPAIESTQRYVKNVLRYAGEITGITPALTGGGSSLEPGGMEPRPGGILGSAVYVLVILGVIVGGVLFFYKTIGAPSLPTVNPVQGAIKTIKKGGS